MSHLEILKFRQFLAVSFYENIKTLESKITDKTTNKKLINFYICELFMFRMMKIICHGYETLPLDDKKLFLEKFETICRDTLDEAIILSEVENENSYIIKLDDIKCYYFIFKKVITKKTYIVNFSSYYNSFKTENPELAALITDYNINIYELNYYNFDIL